MTVLEHEEADMRVVIKMMMPLSKGNPQASGAIIFHILAIRKLTYNPSLLTSSPFSFSVIHSFFLMTGDDRYGL